MTSRTFVDKPSDMLQSFLLSKQSNVFENVTSESLHVRPCTTPEFTLNHHNVVVTLTGQVTGTFFSDSFTAQQHVSRTGDVSIYPAGIVGQWEVETENKFLSLKLEPEAFSRVVSEVVDIAHFELSPRFCFVDPLLQHLLSLVSEGLNADLPLDRLYIDSLINTLVMHLLKYYAAYTPEILQYEDGLSKQQLRKAIDYIKSRLGQEIKLGDLANILGMSQYYFCRLFRQSTGISPYQYVIKQRVEYAKILLKKPQQMAIAEIALECGFSSQSHLCKHFRKLTGTTPKAYRKGC